ncbi:23S rRNA methyltransferase [Clostridia bacterium]|nr:23S rRNA methyltransferase [Clostridia bacterium]
MSEFFKTLKRLARDSKARREAGLMFCDGEKMLAEALSSGITPVHVVSVEPRDIPGVCCETAPYQVIESISALDAPQKLIFTVPLPDLSLRSVGSGKYIILDRLQDPGNVGSIIRTACATGIDAVVLNDGCADVSNPKTLRATMGTIFRQRVMRGTDAEIRQAFGRVPVYAADMSGGANPAEIQGSCAVVIGNEGSGISDFWRGLPTITIPMGGNCESLGAAAAAAIIMWELSKC